MDDNQLEYKIKKYTQKLKSVDSLDKADLYQKRLRKYHRLNQQGGVVDPTEFQRWSDDLKRKVAESNQLKTAVTGDFKRYMDVVKKEFAKMSREAGETSGEIRKATEEMNKAKSEAQRAISELNRTKQELAESQKQVEESKRIGEMAQSEHAKSITEFSAFSDTLSEEYKKLYPPPVQPAPKPSVQPAPRQPVRTPSPPLGTAARPLQRGPMAPSQSPVQQRRR